MKPAKMLCRMAPWACSYLAGGRRYGIVLFATDPDQLERDWTHEIPGFRVEGRLVATEVWK